MSDTTTGRPVGLGHVRLGPVRLGLIGSGWIGAFHAQSIALRVPGAELVAVDRKSVV